MPELQRKLQLNKWEGKKTITGVPRPDWYRPDPNKPTYTITAVLDGKTKGK